MHNISQVTALKKFRCLGDLCEDTCCKNWGMQIGEKTIAKYQQQAPELLAAVEKSEDISIMKRDSCSDYCMKFESGLCSIHRDYGDEFLGDACHFFPRATRFIGEEIIMSAALSCPEITRLAIIDEAEIISSTNPYYEATTVARLPDSTKNYLPDGISQYDAMALHQLIVQYSLDESLSAEQILINLSVLFDALEFQPTENWLAASPMYLKLAQSRAATPEPHIADSFNLLNILVTLTNLSNNQINPRLQTIIAEISKALAVKFEDGALITSENSAQNWLKALQMWQNKWQHPMQMRLKKWLAAEFSLNLFPFSGLGENFQDRLLIVAARFATLRLAIIAHHINYQIAPSDAELTTIIQSLARFLDHLSDPTTSMAFYTQMNWHIPARFNGLLSME